MVERLRIWPLLVYAAFVAFAAARRRETEPTCANGVSEKGRALYSARDKSSEIPHSVRDEGSGSSLESPRATRAETDKRPKEQLENDQPISAQLRRARNRGGDGARRLRGAFPGQVGKIFSGAFTRA
jgi:hypothetical protein